jgi:peptide-methionine (R)-S-oxide reductase
MTTKIVKTEEEWLAELGPVQYKILREAGTERPWSGALLDEKRAGVYTCGACGAELFKSGAKFDSGSGWPSFYESINPDAVTLVVDNSLGRRAPRSAAPRATRTSATCSTTRTRRPPATGTA